MATFEEVNTPRTENFGVPRGSLGSAVEHPGGASGAAPGALRSPGKGALAQIQEIRADCPKCMFMPFSVPPETATRADNDRDDASECSGGGGGPTGRRWRNRAC
ncbi:unnamed protein product [Prorocentrum cordatum]|uniref:Uncharacterized protein n=1 Tax=Prorocentrum cordatum TaxID=2364126 RepID=A0ABN9VQ16_9DINO|nr:unnamed protein product [Polarella glacialis]